MHSFFRHHPRWYLYLFLSGILCGMLLCPKIAAAGAHAGLLLWFDTLLPVLLPFLILSGLIIRLDMTRPFNRLLSPLLCRIFPVSKAACYPLVLGILCGMPLGAATTATLYSRGEISRQDAAFLLAFSNNASLMFLIGYVIQNKLAQPELTLPFLLIIYLSAWLCATLFPEKSKKPLHPSRKSTSSSHPDTASIQASRSSRTLPSFPHAIDESISDALQTITKIGGYIILFSMLSAFLTSLPFLPSACRATCAGILEITGGISLLSESQLPHAQKTALILAITSFGGLSGLMQTRSVTQNSGLPIRHYILQKCIQAVLTYVLTAILLWIPV